MPTPESAKLCLLITHIKKTIAPEHEQITLLPPYITSSLTWRYNLTEQKNSS